MKTCAKCKESKSLEAFNARASRCKPCRAEDKRDPGYRARDNARRREQYANDPEFRRVLLGKNRQHRYGVSQERFDAMLAEQDYSCKICRTGDPRGHGDWAVDHDHACCPGIRSCGECVRGLLCANCNLMLGHAKDDINLLMDAINYLRGT